MSKREFVENFLKAYGNFDLKILTEKYEVTIDVVKDNHLEKEDIDLYYPLLEYANNLIGRLVEVKKENPNTVVLTRGHTQQMGRIDDTKVCRHIIEEKLN